MKTKTAAIAAGLSASAAVAQSSCSNILTPNYNTPTVAAGWQAQLVVGGLTKPRSIEFDDTGALLVVESGKGITRHTFVDNGGTCLTLEKSDVLINEPILNHGLALDPNGRVIYASSAESVFRYEFNARTSSVNSNPSVLVNKMSNNDLVTRTLLLSKKQRGTLLVSRGVPDGDELRAETLSNGLSQIRAFNLNNLTTSASAFPHTYNFNTEGQVLGWGLRNSVGVAEHPVTGGIFAVENSMDGVTRNGKDIHENNPGEELNYLGVLGQDSFGKNYGFPSCFAVWDLNEIPENAGLKVGDQFATDEDKITDEVCNDSGQYEKPRLVMPAHWAPLDIKFDGKGEVAYVSFHGSFDKKSPAGYRVSAIPFDASTGQPKASAQQSTDASAMVDIMTNPDNTVCPGNCFRPAGLAFDSAGRLWMSSDTTGEIFVLQKTDSTAGVFVMPTQGAGAGGKANSAGRLSGGLGWGYLAGLAVAGWFALF